MILPSGRHGLYVVFSKGGKRLSKPESKTMAQHRLAQVEYFKRLKGKRR